MGSYIISFILFCHELKKCFLLKFSFYLKGREKLLIHPNTSESQGWIRLKPGPPNTEAISCCLLRRALPRSWSWRQSKYSHLGPCLGCWHPTHFHHRTKLLLLCEPCEFQGWAPETSKGHLGSRCLHGQGWATCITCAVPLHASAPCSLHPQSLATQPRTACSQAVHA